MHFAGDIGEITTHLELDGWLTVREVDLRLLAGTGVYLLGFSYLSVRRLLALPNPLEEARKSSETCPSSVYNQYQANRKPLSASDSFAVNSV